MVKKDSKCWISKHRYYELKHFCLQYPEWKKAYDYLCEISNLPKGLLRTFKIVGTHGNPTADIALKKVFLRDRMSLVESTANAADEELSEFIFDAVINGKTYDELEGITCDRDIYYDRYRRFFWLLNQER